MEWNDHKYYVVTWMTKNSIEDIRKNGNLELFITPYCSQVYVTHRSMQKKTVILFAPFSPDKLRYNLIILFVAPGPATQ